MPVNREARALDASPRSVADARRWVVDIFTDLGLDSLVDAAELGVSELVTNALLHAAPPLSVRVRGTLDHPRVEVSDGSPVPPVVPEEADDQLTTFGRGLSIVAMCSSAWGATIEDAGKVVWFVPTAEPHADAPPRGDLFDLDQHPEMASSPAADDLQTVRIAGLSVRRYVEFRNHYRELRRELRLLALAHGSEYPIAKSLSELFARFESEVPSLVGSQTLNDALASGAETTDLELTVPRSSQGTVSQMLDLLRLADAFCRAERLLSLATSPEQQAFQQWYLTEFVRQCAGGEPVPWPDQAVDHVS